MSTKEFFSNAAMADLPAGAALLVGQLIQDPRFIWDPYYFLYLLFGIIVVLVSIVQVLDTSLEPKKTLWHLAGVASSGFVLVAWGQYWTFLFGVFLWSVLLIVSAAAAVVTVKKLSKAKGKRLKLSLTIVGFIICGLFPSASLFPTVITLNLTPQVNISPSDSFPTFPPGGATKTENLTVTSYHANSRDVTIVANESNLLTVFLNGQEGGPVTLPYLQVERDYRVALRIQTSPLLPNGTYTVRLNYTYAETLGKSYKDLRDVTAYVGVTSNSTRCCAYSYLPGASTIASGGWAPLGIILFSALGTYLAFKLRQRKNQLSIKY